MRKMMVWREGEKRSLLTEVVAEDEAQLQELVKESPELLPVEEFGVGEPLMVVGRETTLPSGAMDLVALARSGDLLLIEFKTGPQNSDFRRVIAQLFDYGSDLWRMSREEFESTVALRYFASDHCRDDRLKGKASLDEAAREVWPDMSEEEMILFHDRLASQLSTGAFHYVIVAQSFTPTMARTVEYLNAAMAQARVYAVELVRFAAEGVSAFESRTAIKPEAPAGETRRAEPVNEARFLEQIPDADYREALREILEGCRGLGLQIPWGPAGTSIRLKVLEIPNPVSIGWIFPPGVSGWMGLTDLTLGYVQKDYPDLSVASVFEDYVEKVAQIPGVKPASPQWLDGYRLSPEVTVENRHRIIEILADLVQRVSG